MMATNCCTVAFQESPAVPNWLNKGDNSWMMIASTLVSFQCIPGMVILYAGSVRRKWAVNSAALVIISFAEVVLCWVLFGYKMAFGEEMLPFWGKPGPVLDQKQLMMQAVLPTTTHRYRNETVETDTTTPYIPLASMVWFQCVFAATAVISMAGSVLARIDDKVWMIFVPLWLTFSYTVGAFTLWGGGFLYHWGVIDYSGGYVIHLSSGIAGLTAAYWVGPRMAADKVISPPNMLMLAGAGLVWIGWSGYTGGGPYSANIDSSMAVLNTNICAATSLLAWACLDLKFAGNISVIGLIQGLMAGLVCITPGAGLVQGWAAMVMGICSGGVSWYTMKIAQNKWWVLQQIDDTLGSFYTNAVVGYLGGILTGLFAEPHLCSMFLPVTNSRGAFYGGMGGIQLLKQIVGGFFVIAWNISITSLICLIIGYFMPLRLPENEINNEEQNDAKIGEDNNEEQNDASIGEDNYDEQNYASSGEDNNEEQNDAPIGEDDNLIEHDEQALRNMEQGGPVPMDIDNDLLPLRLMSEFHPYV